MALETMEAQKPGSSWKSKKAGDIIQSRSKDPRTRSTNVAQQEMNVSTQRQQICLLSSYFFRCSAEPPPPDGGHFLSLPSQMPITHGSSLVAHPKASELMHKITQANLGKLYQIL